MRYFVIADAEGSIALITHDYRKGSYICRAKTESFASVFDVQVDKQAIKFVREAKGLRIKEFTVFEYEWVDGLLKDIFACNADWFIDYESESSGSDLTVDDLVAEYLGS